MESGLTCERGVCIVYTPRMRGSLYCMLHGILIIVVTNLKLISPTENDLTRAGNNFLFHCIQFLISYYKK